MLDCGKKLEICYEQMSLDYNITEKMARRIVVDFAIQEVVIEYYKEAIEEANRITKH